MNYDHPDSCIYCGQRAKGTLCPACQRADTPAFPSWALMTHERSDQEYLAANRRVSEDAAVLDELFGR